MWRKNNALCAMHKFKLKTKSEKENDRNKKQGNMYKMCTTAAQRTIRTGCRTNGAKPGRLMRHKCVVVNPKASDAPERVTEPAPAPASEPESESQRSLDNRLRNSWSGSASASGSGSQQPELSVCHVYICVNIVKDKRRTMNSSQFVRCVELKRLGSTRCSVSGFCSCCYCCSMAKVRRVSRNRIKVKANLPPFVVPAEQRQRATGWATHSSSCMCSMSIALFGTCLNLLSLPSVCWS